MLTCFFPGKPNAGAHLLPEAGATQERTLEAVRCSALFGADSAPGAAVLTAPEALSYGPERLSPGRGAPTRLCPFRGRIAFLKNVFHTGADPRFRFRVGKNIKFVCGDGAKDTRGDVPRGYAGL